MPTVVEQLRKGREQLGVSIQDAAEATKIGADHIRALEAGDWRTFRAPVYLRGFVRSYAGFLKLDVSQVLRDLDAELGPEAAGKASADLARRPISAASAGAGFFRQIPLKWVLIALGTLALASILYAIKATRRDQPRDPMQQLSSGLYRSQTKPSAGVAPLSSNLPTSRTPEKERDRRPSR